MASTTQTTYYGLPQYIGSDRASWLDTNEPFAAVDTALHTAVTGVEQATTDVASLREDVAQAQLDVSALDGRMDTAELNIGQLQTTVAGHTGDIADVRRDLQDNIESLREETATSTHAYEIGDYFYYNDVLFKATAQIAIGATIVPNTNCTGVTVMDELSQIAPGGNVEASDVSYNNTTSRLTADDVQEAVDELAAEKIDTFSGSVTDASSNTYTAVTADGIAYDATNQQLLLKVNGADTVIPFKKGSSKKIGFMTRTATASGSSWVISAGVNCDTDGTITDNTTAASDFASCSIAGTTITWTCLKAGTYYKNGATSGETRAINETITDSTASNTKLSLTFIEEQFRI